LNRKLVFLNLALLAALAALAWQIRLRWQEAQAREQAVLAGKPPPAPVLPVPAPQTAGPLKPADYLDVAQKMVFSPDRNPEVVIEAAPEKPVPPFPVAHGVIDLGAGATVILSDKPEAPQKSYRAGDKVGQFQLASVSSKEIVLEWEGKTFSKTIAELKVKEKPPEQAQPAAAVSQSQPIDLSRNNPHQITSAEKLAEAQKALNSASGNMPGIDTGGSVRNCAPGDDSPPGTVMGGYRKVVTSSPFGGRACRWEPVR
jgi:hypothetical protein